MANRYDSIIKNAIESDEEENLEASIARALETHITDADREKWFAESKSGMTRNVKEMQSALDRVFPDHYVQIEPSGSAHNFTIQKHA